MFSRGEISKFIKDILFPVYCLSCEKEEGNFLCKKCLQTLDYSGVFDCPVCHKRSTDGQTCQGCQKKTYLDNEIAIFEYKESYLIAKILHEFKYNFIEELKVLLGFFIDKFLEKNINYFSDIDFIISVPLHKKRYAERGFNQSDIIAQLLSEKLNKKFIDALSRKKKTDQQAKLNREKRFENLENAFEIKKNLKIDLNNKTILLVDDVYTTGATLGECGKVLRENNVKIIKSFTIGRGL